MKQILYASAAVACALMMCSNPCSANSGSRSKEIYAIFDLTTSAPKPVVIKALLDGMTVNIDRSETMQPVVLDAPPEKPDHFKLVDPIENSPMASFLSMMPASQRAMMKRATCDGAVWVADAVRHVEGMHTLHLTLCLFQYQRGFALDAWGIEMEDRGGGLGKILGRAIAGKIVGTPDAWVSKTLLDLVRSARNATGADVHYVDGSLDFNGDPWNKESQLTAAQEHLDPPQSPPR